MFLMINLDPTHDYLEVFNTVEHKYYILNEVNLILSN